MRVMLHCIYQWTSFCLNTDHQIISSDVTGMTCCLGDINFLDQPQSFKKDLASCHAEAKRTELIRYLMHNYCCSSLHWNNLSIAASFFLGRELIQMHHLPWLPCSIVSRGLIQNPRDAENPEKNKFPLEIFEGSLQLLPYSGKGPKKINATLMSEYEESHFMMCTARLSCSTTLIIYLKESWHAEDSKIIFRIFAKEFAETAKGYRLFLFSGESKYLGRCQQINEQFFCAPGCAVIVADISAMAKQGIMSRCNKYLVLILAWIFTGWFCQM